MPGKAAPYSVRYKLYQPVFPPSQTWPKKKTVIDIYSELDLQTFRCRPGMVMTVNFLYLANDIDDSATLSFYDGTAVTSPLLGTFKVNDTTQGVA